MLCALKATGSCEMTLAPSTLAQWVGGVGTSLAVIVALFKDSIRVWRRKPRFHATCGKETPRTVRTPIIASDGRGAVWNGECYFVRVRVENTGKTRAEKVEISASKLDKRGPDNKTFADLTTILPLDLKWSNRGVAILDGISPKMGAFCDIVAVCDPAKPYQRKPAGTPPNVTVGQLQLEVDPFTESHLLPPGTYKLTLRIAAANVLPVDKTLEFTHTGAWMQDDAAMRRDCLGASLE